MLLLLLLLPTFTLPLSTLLLLLRPPQWLLFLLLLLLSCNLFFYFLCDSSLPPVGPRHVHEPQPDRPYPPVRRPRVALLLGRAGMPKTPRVLPRVRLHLGVEHPQHEVQLPGEVPLVLVERGAQQQGGRVAQRLPAVRRGQVGAKLQVLRREDKEELGY